MSLLLLALAIITPAPRDTVRYAVTFPDPTHHETRIAVDFPAAGDTLEVWMSRSSPGRYALHEFAVAGQEDWTALLAAHVPGDSIRLVFQQRGREVRAVLRLKADPRLEVRSAELAGLGFTEAQRAFRTAWLGSRAGP